MIVIYRKMPTPGSLLPHVIEARKYELIKKHAMTPDNHYGASAATRLEGVKRMTQFAAHHTKAMSKKLKEYQEKKLPAYKEGGLIKQTGLVKAHAGELVIKKERVAAVVKAVRAAGLKPLKK